jgi:hypothetical protein
MSLALSINSSLSLRFPYNQRAKRENCELQIANLLIETARPDIQTPICLRGLQAEELRIADFGFA